MRNIIIILIEELMMPSKKIKLEEKSNIKKHGGARYPNGGGKQPGAGRPAFVPTDTEREQVEALSGYGLPFEHIAVLIRDGIHIDTLREHFSTELLSGKAKANGQIGKTLFQKAMGGDTGAMIWWSKTQMRWTETQRHEIDAKIQCTTADDLEAARARILAMRNESDH